MLLFFRFFSNMGLFFPCHCISFFLFSSFSSFRHPFWYFEPSTFSQEVFSDQAVSLEHITRIRKTSTRFSQYQLSRSVEVRTLTDSKEYASNRVFQIRIIQTVDDEKSNLFLVAYRIRAEIKPLRLRFINTRD